jgi:glucan phosphoethanolaminetransferase (alkaline phosphatase superfamily)
VTVTTPSFEAGREPSLSRFRAAAGTTRRLRALARYRKRLAWVILLTPLLLVVAVDVQLRGGRLMELSPGYMGSYAFAMVESAMLWGALLLAASARRGWFRWLASALFVLLSVLAVGVQVYFHRQYSIYLNLDATLFGTSLSTSVFGQLRADGGNFLWSTAPPLVASLALVWVVRRVARPRRLVARVSRFVVPVAVGAVFLLPCSYRTVQASTPDVIYFHAIGGLLKQLTGVHATAQVRPGLRTPPRLPALMPSPTAPKRSVLLLLTESVRADVHCSAKVEECPISPSVNIAAPLRLPLLQMRSNSSTTAIQLAVLWSGLEPTASREALHTAPLLFDYAHAAGIESAYWTSHHMMFANSRLYVQDLPTQHQCGATDLDPLADVDLGGPDELLTARALADLSHMKEPFFGVVHVGNTHVPYRVDPSKSPFVPSVESKAPGDNEAYRNYYKNAVYLQDEALGAFLRAFRATPAGARTVILFTSDHGEAFREHGQVGHTGAVLDEEIHVPFWVDAPPDVLTASERQALEAARDRLAFHTDVTPTILDLFGLWDLPELARYRSAMIGESLLRDHPERQGRGEGMAPVALTNCTEIWGCAFRNWGLMRGAMKLSGREWDSAWRCYDVLADPREERDLGPEGCGELPALAQSLYGGPPAAR